MYHVVCSAKYRRAVFSNEVEMKLKKIRSKIQKRYEIEFLEISSDDDERSFSRAECFDV